MRQVRDTLVVCPPSDSDPFSGRPLYGRRAHGSRTMTGIDEIIRFFRHTYYLFKYRSFFGGWGWECTRDFREIRL